MKIDKKKIVFVSIVAMVLIFIVSYTMLVFMEEDLPPTLEQPVVPELREEQKTYKSKMDALNDLKEEREREIPSIYSEKMFDSLGAFDPALEEEEREWKVDSIYRYGIVNPDAEDFYLEDEFYSEENPQGVDSFPVPEISIQDLTIGHKSFFNTGVISEVEPHAQEDQRKEIKAEVNGTQTVRTNDRVELILTEAAEIGGELVPKNSLIYGFVIVQVNRVQIKITHVNNMPMKLKAYDLQDSNEGIYVANSFRADVGREVLDDVVQDINIAGLPQVSGIKNIFRRNNRNLKVTILDQYQLILKPEL